MLRLNPSPYILEWEIVIRNVTFSVITYRVLLYLLYLMILIFWWVWLIHQIWIDEQRNVIQNVVILQTRGFKKIFLSPHWPDFTVIMTAVVIRSGKYLRNCTLLLYPSIILGVFILYLREKKEKQKNPYFLLLTFLFTHSKYSLQILKIIFSLIQPMTICSTSVHWAQVSIQLF